MDPTLTALLLATLLVGLTAWLGSRYRDLKRIYYIGIATWSRWLPVCAVGLYLAVLAVNLLLGGNARNPLALSGHFSSLELTVFFLVGPLFLTRMGNILASATVLYFIERLLMGPAGGDAPLALYLLTGAATVIALLADKMPWLEASGPSPVAHKFREVLLAFVTIAAMGVVFMCMMRVPGFSRWMAVTLSVSLPHMLIMALLVAVFLGWLSVAIGQTRHFTIPLLCLPSIFILAYVTSWPSALLVIPFATCVALSLATADRRHAIRRRTGHTAFAFLR